MSTITVPLENIITDEANPIDLTALPEAEAIAHIQEIYGFLAKSVDVSIEDGIATISLSEAKASQVTQALSTFERAGKAAQRGKYIREITRLKISAE